MVGAALDDRNTVRHGRGAVFGIDDEHKVVLILDRRFFEGDADRVLAAEVKVFAEKRISAAFNAEVCTNTSSVLPSSFGVSGAIKPKHFLPLYHLTFP